ncbi:MAG: glycine cleavage system protein GcvH [Candidatus Omnitrophica bacterium]|nr:glycine cleavage system protein GcvH [Candidatus Omnitrophota bacterium]
MEIIDYFLYSKEHEWVSLEDGIATIGISEYAQAALGDITFIELPSIDDEIDQFEQIASVESVKAASDIFSPMSGKIVDINGSLENDPGLINKSCYEKGWIIKIEISEKDEKSNLMTAEEYRNFLNSVR